MKKALLLGVALSVSISLLGCSAKESAEKDLSAAPQETFEMKLDTGDNFVATAEDNNESVIDTITNLIEGFGSKLQLVSLLSPADVLEESIKENYIDFVSPELITKWTADPESAPGRLVSSPWPDRIEIESIDMISQEEYKVLGKIVEVTSVEAENNGVAAKRAIQLKVVKLNDNWIINEVVLGEYDK